MSGETIELARALVAARTAAGINQVDVAARTKISQSQLSRLENGKAVPSEDDVETLCRLYGLDEPGRKALLAMTRDALAGVRDRRLVIQRGSTLAMQQRWRRIEGEALVVREYHPAIVVGVLQTPAYAAVVLEEPPDSPVVQDRQARRERLLSSDTPRFVLIQTEGALRFRVGSAQVMAGQLAAIAEASRRPNVEFGLLPASCPVDVVPVCGFSIYDDQAAVVGLEVAAATLTSGEDVAEFRARFERLRPLAVWGDEARAELDRIATGY